MVDVVTCAVKLQPWLAVHDFKYGDLVIVFAVRAIEVENLRFIMRTR